MELEHSFTVPVSKARAWDVLLDVERVAPCMPGATLDSVDGDEIVGKIKVKVGPISMTYTGTAKFVERDEQAGVVRLDASGKETRGSGTASASVRSVLEDRGDETHVTVHTTLNVTGKPAQFGRGVMTEVSGKLIGIFATNLADMIARSDDGSAASPATDTAPLAADTAPPAAASAPVADVAPAADTAPAQSSLALENLGLSARTLASLHSGGITTVEQLAGKSEDELLALDGIGRASVTEIKAKLAEPGQPGPASQPASTASPAPAAPPVSSAPSGTTTPVTTGNGQASANGSRTGSTATSVPKQSPQPTGEDSLNLIKVAGMPVLKRSIPVIAGVTAVIIIGWRRKTRRRNK
jgi:carbon monoxide dehydrogenase subunit G